eukprot:360819-Chlamydomonas_euryale.AAC.5
MARVARACHAWLSHYASTACAANPSCHHPCKHHACPAGQTTYVWRCGCAAPPPHPQPHSVLDLGALKS